MVQKTATMGATVMVAVSAPTALAVRMAHAAGLDPNVRDAIAALRTADAEMQRWADRRAAIAPIRGRAVKRLQLRRFADLCKPKPINFKALR
jgi:hypothetical protein